MAAAFLFGIVVTAALRRFLALLLTAYKPRLYTAILAGIAGITATIPHRSYLPPEIALRSILCRSVTIRVEAGRTPATEQAPDRYGFHCGFRKSHRGSRAVSGHAGSCAAPDLFFDVPSKSPPAVVWQEGKKVFAEKNGLIRNLSV